jgi:tRNA pseudouridine synthase 10
MFALLGTDTTNYERGNSLLFSLTLDNHKTFFSEREDEKKNAINKLKILAENARYLPAQKVLEKEGIVYQKNNLNESCYLCHDIFYNLEKYVNSAIEKINNVEFYTFLCGTTPDSNIINQEDKFKSEFTLLESESFKNHFNREVGKLLLKALNKQPDFANPDIVIIFSLGFDNFKIELIIRSLFISGRYNKLIRGIPQTKWLCRNCQGKGCELCNFTGKQYEISVEQLISPIFINESQATDSKFHGAGREDIDVRMLGPGRPFILELRKPKLRTLNLKKIEDQINQIHQEKIKISNLKYSGKNEVINLKFESERVKKVYRALVKPEQNISKEEFEYKLIQLKTQFEGQFIHQRTPNRVSHRRADKVRKKIIYNIVGEYLKPDLFKFIIETQGGTYIKELINGDNQRTVPSFSEIFKDNLNCVELDVIDIKQ